MKKTLVLLVFVAALFSCKNDSKSEVENSETKIETEANGKTAKQNDGLTLLKGEFVYYADAAVLQTHREVYGVVINEKMHELNNQVKQYKQEDTDMVPVEIRAEIINKPENEEGWPHRVIIKEILSVEKPDPNKNDVVKLGSK
ncbi:hypothetical protein [Corallibacter sp.]|uniref:hypothetical protein n=1 Tax=Corallibacter sp. TaxID=2038084 RepID=UPI003A8EE8F9